MNVNRVFLAGRLTRDPQLRYTPSGSAVCEFGLAVNRFGAKDEAGQRREETCFVDIVLWAKLAELCAKYLRKGSPLYVEGRLSYDSWEGSDGQKKTRLRVTAENFQFVDQPGERRPREQEAPAADALQREAPVTEPPAGAPGEDLPF